MAEFPTFRSSWPWLWPWIGSYCIPSCITRRPLPKYQISWKSRNFLWTDERTDVRTCGRKFQYHFIRWTRKSRPKTRERHRTAYRDMVLIMYMLTQYATHKQHVRPATRLWSWRCILPTAFIIPLVIRAVCSRSFRSSLTAFSRPSTYTRHIFVLSTSLAIDAIQYKMKFITRRLVRANKKKQNQRRVRPSQGTVARYPVMLCTSDVDITTAHDTEWTLVIAWAHHQSLYWITRHPIMPVYNSQGGGLIIRVSRALADSSSALATCRIGIIMWINVRTRRRTDVLVKLSVSPNTHRISAWQCHMHRKKLYS